MQQTRSMSYLLGACCGHTLPDHKNGKRCTQSALLGEINPIRLYCKCPLFELVKERNRQLNFEEEICAASENAV